MDFDTLTEYALGKHRKALLRAVLRGRAVPAFEQPCWDCGRLRYFWDDEMFGVVEQCCSG